MEFIKKDYGVTFKGRVILQSTGKNCLSYNFYLCVFRSSVFQVDFISAGFSAWFIKNIRNSFCNGKGGNSAGFCHKNLPGKIVGEACRNNG